MLKMISRICLMSFCLLLSTGTIFAQDATAAGTYNEGLALLKSKDYENGLEKMEAALALAEADANEQIIKLSKKNGAVAAYNLGNTKRKAKDYDGALAMYNKGIEMNPLYSSNYEGVARAQEGKGEKIDAVNNYILAAKKATDEGKADRAKSRYKNAETLIGKTYVAKNYDMAIDMAKAYVGGAPANADVNYYMSRSLAAQDNYTEAIAAMRTAIELKGDAVPDKYTFYLAEQLEKSGSKSEAASLYRKVTEEKYKAQAEYRAGQIEK